MTKHKFTDKEVKQWIQGGFKKNNLNCLYVILLEYKDFSMKPMTERISDVIKVLKAWNSFGLSGKEAERVVNIMQEKS